MPTVEEVCAAIEQHRLIPSAELAVLKERWFKPSRLDADDVEQFGRWLVVNRHLTDFAVRVLLQGKAEQLVFHQYQIRDRLAAGPMAGSLLATNALGQQVAIDVLAPEVSRDEGMLLGIYAAVQRVQKVQHPNVGRIIELAEANRLYYLVEEHYEGATLESILERRGRLEPLRAAQIFSLAFAGLEALHAEKVPGGDLKADCLILTPTGQGASKQRTLKILHAAIRRRAFDNEMLGAGPAQAIPDNLQLATSVAFSAPTQADAEQDLFRLGCTFYRALTGQAPFPPEELPVPSKPAAPVRQLNPQVPELLAELVEQTIDPNPSARPRSARDVAKRLRVFLTTAEDEQAAKPEELVSTAGPPPEAAEDEEEVGTYGLEGGLPAAPARRRPRREQPAPTAAEEEPAAAAPAPAPKAGEVPAGWEQYRPGQRDILFMLVGAAVLLVAVLITRALSGLQVVNVVCLMVGATLTLLVEQFLVLSKRPSPSGRGAR